MVYTVSITSQGQISIPAKIRRELGIKKGSRAIVTAKKGEIVIKPVADFFSLRGSLKTSKPPLTSEQIHEFVAQEVAKEYGRELQRIKTNKE